MTCMFSCPNSDHVMLFREFAFCLTRVIKVRSVHSWWKSKRMLATYMRRMRNNNLEIRIAGDKKSPQLIMYTYACGCTCLGRTYNIKCTMRGFEMGKKNIQSRKVYCNEAVGIAKWSYVNSLIY